MRKKMCLWLVVLVCFSLSMGLALPVSAAYKIGYIYVQYRAYENGQKLNRLWFEMYDENDQYIIPNGDIVNKNTVALYRLSGQDKIPVNIGTVVYDGEYYFQSGGFDTSAAGEYGQTELCLPVPRGGHKCGYAGPAHRGQTGGGEDIR